MNANARFYVLLGFVIATIFALYLLVRSQTPKAVTEQVQTTAKQNIERAAPPLSAGAVSQNLTPIGSHEASTRLPDSGKSGAHALGGWVTLESDGSPVPGAEVRLYWTDDTAQIQTYGEEEPWRAQTNATGFFRIEKLPVAHFIVVASKDNLADITNAGIRASQLDDELVALKLSPTGTINGVVLNEKGEPIEGALVALGLGKRGNETVSGRFTHAKSGKDGAFELNYVKADALWAVQAKADGYAHAIVPDVSVNSANVEIVLSAGATVSGRVVMADTKEPVPNVRLKLTPNGSYIMLNSHKAASRRDGSFTFDSLSKQEYSLALDNQPYVLAFNPPRISIEGGKQFEDIELVVSMGGSISGRATDATTGAPIHGMNFVARNNATFAARGETDEDGNYKLQGLASANYTVRYSNMPGYRNNENREGKAVTVTLGQEVTGIDFAVEPGLSMHGRVVDTNGNPLPMVKVVSENDTQEEGDWSVSDDQGRWIHRGFSPGTVLRITAQKGGFAALPIEGVTIPDHDLLDFEIVMDIGGSVSGVVLGNGGIPVDGARIVASPEVPVRGQPPFQTETKNGGNFTLSGVTEGTYVLRAAGPHGDATPLGISQPDAPLTPRAIPQPAGITVRVAKGQNVIGVRITIDYDLESKLAGRVVDSAGAPIPDARVSIILSRGDRSSEALSDKNGDYEIAGVAQGLYEVSAYRKGYASFREENVAAPNNSFNITLSKRASISGRVIDDRAGQPLQRFSITSIRGQISLSNALLYGRDSGDSVSNENGAFEVTSDPGGVTLYAIAEGFAPALHFIPDIQEGEARSGIDIRLKAGGVVEGVVNTLSGEPVVAARINVGSPIMVDAQLRDTPAAVTDANGAFSIGSLPTEKIQIFAAHGDFAITKATVVPSPMGTAAPLRIIMAPAGSVKGAVRVNGRPAAKGNVSIFYANGSYQNNVAVDRNDGTYFATGLPEGTARLHVAGVQSDSSKSSVTREVNIVSGETTVIDFDLLAGTAVLEGTVTRGGSAVLDADVEVSFGASDEVRQRYRASTDATGAYRLEGLPAGTTNASVRTVARNSPSQRSRIYAIELIDGQVTRLDANLDGGAQVTGSVSGLPQGVRADIALLVGQVAAPTDASEATFSRLNELMAAASQVSADGSFSLEGVLPGEYTLIIVAQSSSGENAIQFKTTAVSVTENGLADIQITFP